jgi:tetratricopeptide (TPR) repeat protein
LEVILGRRLSLLRDNQGNSSSLHQTAAAHARIGAVRWQLGLHEQAEQDLRQAVVIQEQLLANHPADIQCRWGLLGYWSQLGKVLSETNQREQTLQAHEKVNEELRKLAESEPDTTVYRVRQATLLMEQGRVLSQWHRRVEAEQLLRQAMALFERLAREFPDRGDLHANAARTANYLGVALKRDNRFAEARQAYVAAIARLKELVARDSADRLSRLELGTSYRNLAMLERDSGDRVKARVAYEMAKDLLEPLVRERPGQLVFRRELGEALLGLFLILPESTPPTEARRRLSEAQGHLLQAFEAGPHHTQLQKTVRNTYYQLANLHLKEYNHRSAAAAVREMIRLSHEQKAFLDAAGLLTQCMSVALRDPRLDEAQRLRLGQAYAGQAARTGWLSRARFPATSMKTLKSYPALAPLLKRPEFGSLNKELTTPALAGLARLPRG